MIQVLLHKKYHNIQINIKIKEIRVRKVNLQKFNQILLSFNKKIFNILCHFLKGGFNNIIFNLLNVQKKLESLLLSQGFKEFGLMEMFIMEALKMEGEMDLLFKYFKIVNITMEISKMICFMEKGFTTGIAINIFQELFKLELKQKVHGGERINIQEKSRTISVMGQEHIYTQMVVCMKASGLWAKEMDPE